MTDSNQIRINELARELEVKAKAIIDYLPEAGVTEKKTHSSSIDVEAAEKVRKHFQDLAERAKQAAAAKAEAEKVAKEAAAKAARLKPSHRRSSAPGTSRAGSSAANACRAAAPPAPAEPVAAQPRSRSRCRHPRHPSQRFRLRRQRDLRLLRLRQSATGGRSRRRWSRSRTERAETCGSARCWGASGYAAASRSARCGPSCSAAVPAPPASTMRPAAPILRPPVRFPRPPMRPPSNPSTPGSARPDAASGNASCGGRCACGSVVPALRQALVHHCVPVLRPRPGAIRRVLAELRRVLDRGRCVRAAPVLPPPVAPPKAEPGKPIYERKPAARARPTLEKRFEEGERKLHPVRARPGVGERAHRARRAGCRAAAAAARDHDHRRHYGSRPGGEAGRAREGRPEGTAGSRSFRFHQPGAGRAHGDQSGRIIQRRRYRGFL